MSICRELLDWSQPALVSAANWLLAQRSSEREVDLSDFIVVVPGGRAGRRLLELLVQFSGQQGKQLAPPEICTIGTLPELLYTPQRPFADEMVQKLVWAAALRSSNRDPLRRVIRQLPSDDDTLAWVELATDLRHLHHELAAARMDFNKVATTLVNLEGPPYECDRWSVLADVQKSYLDRLDQLRLWDIQTARLVAIDRGECSTEKQIVLIATVDMDEAIRAILNQVSDHVTALIYAPTQWSERFDAYGCLVAEAWQNTPLGINNDQVRLVNRPADQAAAVVETIASWNGRHRAEEITIGVPDERLIPWVENYLEKWELPSRWGPGRPLSETSPYRGLQAIGTYVASGHYTDFAALIRHPDMHHWISQQGISGDWLSDVDDFHAEHLPARLTEHWTDSMRHHQRAVQVFDTVSRLVSSLIGPPRPLVEWADRLLDVLRKLYEGRVVDNQELPQRATLTACREIANVISTLVRIPRQLVPQLTAADAIGWILEQLSGIRVAAPADHESIEMLGWLELPWDDSPALVVTSFNEGFVPKSINADQFLTNTLRKKLGLDDNARRYARDAYATAVLLGTRKEITLLVGRYDVEGEPRVPSRLLFATEHNELADRTVRLFSPEAACHQPNVRLARREVVRIETGFDVPRPEKQIAPAAHISVTDFKTYLECPYRFYLSRILCLNERRDEARELNGGAFGSLLHEVLGEFGHHAERDSTDPDEILRILHHELNEISSQRFGKCTTSSVSLQIEQMRLRLAAFAKCQARWARRWKIHYVERPGEQREVTWEVDGHSIQLRGRIDRVDMDRETGEVVILDYKTNDNGDPPDKTHRSQGQWIDLQLPLYRQFSSLLEIPDEASISLGYAVLPKDPSKVDFLLARWTDSELNEAEETARHVVRELCNNSFWPPRDPPPKFAETWAAICMDGVFDRPCLK